MASQFTTISAEDKAIIFHAEKSLLFFKGSTWVKKENPKFDVGMGSFDGAENCDIVGLFLLSQIQHLDTNIGLYRDDGLAASCLSAQQTDAAKKEICRIFNSNGLRITIEANVNTVNFLDITMDLQTCTYKPFMKDQSNPQYIHVNSNHPPNILKNIPVAVNKRLNEISSNEYIFNEAVKPYQEALIKSGYKHNLKFEPNNNNQLTNKKKCRNRRLLPQM